MTRASPAPEIGSDADAAPSAHRLSPAVPAVPPSTGAVNSAAGAQASAALLRLATPIPRETLAKLRAAREATLRKHQVIFSEAQDRKLIVMFQVGAPNVDLSVALDFSVAQIKRRLEWMYAQGIVEPRKGVVNRENVRASVIAANQARREAMAKAGKMRRCLGITYDNAYCKAEFLSSGPGHRLCDDCRKRS